MIRRIIIFICILLLLSTYCFATEQIDITKMQFTSSGDIQAKEVDNLTNYTVKIINDEVKSGVYKVKLSNFSNEFTYEIIRIDSSYSMFLFGVDKNSNIKLIGKYDGDGIINTAKVDVFYYNEYLKIISQKPFSAFYSELILKCDSSNIIKIVQRNGDPSKETLKKEKELLSKGDIKGFEKLSNSEEGNIMYPSSYQDFGNIGLFAIQICHDLALKQYKKGKVKEAIQMAESGIDIFFNNNYLWDYYDFGEDEEYNWKSEKGLTKEDVQKVLSKYKDWQSQYSNNPDKLISLEEFAAVLNDYAFFLMEAHQYREAKSYLDKVILLNPKRVAAYINIADANWELGNKLEAKTQYEQYLKLLGKNTKNVPKRVIERVRFNQ